MVYIFYNWIGSNLLESRQILKCLSKKSETDDCEHDFASLKLRNPKPTQNDTRKHTARRATTRTSEILTKLNDTNINWDQAIYTDDLV